MSKIFYILLFFLCIIFINCQNCTDENCIECSKDRAYFYKCKNGFVSHYSKCGKKCNSIKNCVLCDAKESKCVKCKNNCKFTGIECDCTERYILTIGRWANKVLLSLYKPIFYL